MPSFVRYMTNEVLSRTVPKLGDYVFDKYATSSWPSGHKAFCRADKMKARLPALQEKRKFIAAVDSTGLAISDVNVLRAGVYHFDGYLNRLHCRIAAERHVVV